MSNIWEKLKTRSNKTSYELSQKLNLPEEKVKEIIKGEREVPANEIDRVHEAFSTKKVEKVSDFEFELMKKYFADNDIGKLREEFNYQNVAEMAEAIGIGVATLYRLRPHKIDLISRNTIIKAYNFFQDGFNKKAIKSTDKISNYNKKSSNLKIKKEDLSQEILNWYYNTDIKALRNSKGFSDKKMCLELGFNESYVSSYCKFENKKEGLANWAIVQQMYNYWNNKELLEIKPNEENDIWEEIKPEDGFRIVPTQCELVEENVMPPIAEEKINNGAYIPLEEYNKVKEELERYKYLIDLAKRVN